MISSSVHVCRALGMQNLKTGVSALYTGMHAQCYYHEQIHTLTRYMQLLHPGINNTSLEVLQLFVNIQIPAISNGGWKMLWKAGSHLTVFCTLMAYFPSEGFVFTYNGALCCVS